MQERLDEGSELDSATSEFADLLRPGSARLLATAGAVVQHSTGEEIGVVMREQSDQEERLRETSRAVVESLLYPAFLYVGTLAATAAALFLFLPQLATSLGLGPDTLSESARVLHFALLGLTAPLLFGPALYLAARVSNGVAGALEGAARALPVVGRLMRLRHSAALVTACRISLAAGQSSSEAVRLFPALANSRFSDAAAAALVSRIESGSPLATDESGVDPRVLHELDLALGSPRPKAALERLERSIDSELSTFLGRVRRLVEPVAHTVIAVIVGSVLLGVVRLLLSIYEQTL